MFIALKRFFCSLLLAGTIAVHPAAAETPALLVLGDSLSAGYGVAVEQGWVELLRHRLEAEGYPYSVVNASVSGETSRGALERLPTLLQRHDPALVIVELGGNDGLRGLPLSRLSANLAAIIERSRESGATVLLVGMRMPPNYGPAYTGRFAAVYRDLARRYEVRLVPFLLEGAAGDSTLMQADGMHAGAAAQPILLENVWAELEPLLEPHGDEVKLR